MQAQTQTQTQTGVDVYHLAFGDADDEERNRLLDDLRHRIRMDEEYAPTQDDFDMLWTFVGHDDGATLATVFERWNAGSRHESVAFARRECQDCDAVFTGTPEPGAYTGPVNLAERQRRAEKHERATRTDPTDSTSGHTVAPGTRSLSVGDVVVVDGTAHVVAPFSFREWDHLDAAPVGDA